MELQELVERIQRWKERTNPQSGDTYNAGYEEEAVGAEEAMDNGVEEEVLDSF